MSGKLVGEVYTRELGHAEQAIMLAMADHADDFGGNCFPSVPYIAWKTGYHERQVQRLIARLRDMGALILVREASRYRPTEYHVNLDALPAKPAFRDGEAEPAGVTFDDARGDISAAPGVTFPATGVTFTTPGVTFGAPRGDIYDARGDIAMSPEPPIEPKPEPPIEPKTYAATSVAAAPTFSAQTLAHISASLGGVRLTKANGGALAWAGQVVAMLGDWTGDDPAAAAKIWDDFRHSDKWRFKGSNPTGWTTVLGDWYANERPSAPARPTAPTDNRPPIGAVLSRLGLSESQPERWPPDVLARYPDIAAMWGYAPAGGAS